MAKRLTMAEQLNSAEERYQELATKYNHLMAETARLTEQKVTSDIAIAQAIKAIHDHEGRAAALAEAEKKLKAAESSRDYWNKQYDEVHKEIEAAHDVLNGVADSPPQKYQLDGYDRTRGLVARLAGTFVALAKGGR